MQSFDYPRIGERLLSCELENGLRIFVVPKPGFAAKYAAFATNYGGAHRRFVLNGKAKDTPAGVAHFLEHKMFDLPGGDNALSILSRNGADPNAFTSSGMTCYYFQCTDSFEENLRMLLHFVSTPYFTAETVQKEQGIIAQEIRMGEDNPGIKLYYDTLSLLYARHPIRDRVAGTVESIAQITDRTLYDCHSAFYAPSNMVLCVEGDVDPALVERIAREELSEERRSAPVADFGEPEKGLPGERIHRRQMEVSAPLFYIGARLEPEAGGERALRQRLVSQLAMRLLAGSSSPFFTELYAEGLLNQDFDYEVDFTAGTATVLLGGESAEPERVFERFKAELERVAAQGLDEAAFLRAKRASIGSRLRGLEDFDNVCVSLATGYFSGFQMLDGIELLESVAVSECQDFIRRCLVPEGLALAIIEPKG